MTYVELEEKVKAMKSSAPIKWAFGREQENEMLASWGLTRSEEDLDKIAEIFWCGYALKTDIPRIKEIFDEIQTLEEDFYDNNPKEFAAKVYNVLIGYESKIDGLKSFHFRRTERNKKIVQNQYDKFCKMCCRHNGSTYTQKSIDYMWNEL